MVIPRRTDRPRLHALLHAVRPGAAAQVEDAGDAVVEEQLPLVPVVVNVRVDQARNDVLSSRIDHGDSGRYRLPPSSPLQTPFMTPSWMRMRASLVGAAPVPSMRVPPLTNIVWASACGPAPARVTAATAASVFSGVVFLRAIGLITLFSWVLLGSPRSHIVTTPSSATLF